MTLLFTIYLISAILCATSIAFATRAYNNDPEGVKGKTFAIEDIDEIFIAVVMPLTPVANIVFIYFVIADTLVGENHLLNRVLFRLFTGKRWKKQ